MSMPALAAAKALAKNRLTAIASVIADMSLIA